MSKNNEMDVISQILDENYEGNITLYDEQNNPIEFEQAIVINIDGDNIFHTIMFPVTPMEGVKENEGVLFEINADKYEIRLVTDEKTIDKVLTFIEQNEE